MPHMLDLEKGARIESDDREQVVHMIVLAMQGAFGRDAEWLQDADSIQSVGTESGEDEREAS